MPGAVASYLALIGTSLCGLSGGGKSICGLSVNALPFYPAIHMEMFEQN